jgi:hypothetical protein
MGAYLRLFALLAVAATSVAAKADPLIFTLTDEPGDKFRFSLPSMPTPESSGPGFFTIFDVLVAQNAVHRIENLTFLDGNNGGGIDIAPDFVGLFSDAGGPGNPVLFTGMEAHPRFLTGEFKLGPDSSYTLEIAHISPEPSSFVLLGTGVLGVIGTTWRRVLSDVKNKR